MKKYLSIVYVLATCLLACVFPTSTAAQDEFLPFGHTWKFFRGTTAPSSPDATAWRMPIFDDSTWEMGATGIGYGDDDDVTILDDMEGNYASVYLRTTFNVTHVVAVTDLLLSAHVDDGMIVYLNGDEVARLVLGAPLTEVTFEDLAGAHDAGEISYFDLTVDLPSLLEGENVLAVEVHNQTLDSSDLSFNARLTSNDPRGNCPSGLSCETRNSGVMMTWNNAILYDSISLTRDTVPVAGSPFPGDTTEFFDDNPGEYGSEYVITATIGGVACDPLSWSIPRLDIELIEVGDDWRFFRGTQAPSDPITDWRGVIFDDSQWEIGPTGIGYGDNDDNTVLDDMMGNYRAVFLRKTFRLPDPSLLGNLVLYVDYDDGYIAYIDGNEVARSASMGDPGVEFAFDQASQGGREAGAESATDLTAQLASLSAGEHVLAVEVHNATINSSDLSIAPELDINTCSTDLDCALDEETGNVVLTITNLTAGPIVLTRNGDDLPGSPFPSGTTEVIDTSPTTADNHYTMTVSIDGLACPESTCTLSCSAQDSGELLCDLSLVDGVTQAQLSWQTPANTESIDVMREGDMLARLPGADTFYLDPDVESTEPESDTDYTVAFNFTNGETCTISCAPVSLCPDKLSCEIVDGNVVLTWDTILKNWESFTINRDGSPIASIPGDSTAFTDDTVSLVELLAVDYDVIPVAPIGEEVTGCDQSCSVVSRITESARYETTNSLSYFVDFGVGQDAYASDLGVAGNLDGNWVRDLAQDFWDGSAPLVSGAAPDGDAPGGIAVESVSGQDPCLSDGSILRILDPGNPGTPTGALEDFFPNPYNNPDNASYLLGLPTGVLDRNLLRDGVTFVARWRLSPDPPNFVSTTGQLDGNPLGEGLGQIGFVYLNDGSLATGASASVSFSMNSDLNLSLGTDPQVTAPLAGDTFVSIWVTVQDPEGDETYEVTTHVNGLTSHFPGLTVSGAALQTPVADFGLPTGNYLVLGAPSGTGDSDVQIDYIGYTPGIISPTQANCGGGGTGFRRGDHDGSGVTDITDSLNTLGFLFLGLTPPICLDASDADNSGAIDISDALNALTFLFLGSVQIPPPGPNDCGEDPSVIIPAGQVLGLPEQPATTLGCEQYPGAAFQEAACP